MGSSQIRTLEVLFLQSPSVETVDIFLETARGQADAHLLYVEPVRLAIVQLE